MVSGTTCRVLTSRSYPISVNGLHYSVRAVAQGQAATRTDSSDQLTVTSSQDCQVPR
jgi:hypothetical protein